MNGKADIRLPHDQCAKIAASLSRKHETVLRIAARGSFHVSRRYRDDGKRRMCRGLKELGLLHGGRGQKYGDGHSYVATPAGMCVLGILESLRRKSRTTPKGVTS